MTIHKYLKEFIRNNKDTEGNYSITCDLLLELEKKYSPSKIDIYNILETYLFQQNDYWNRKANVPLEEFMQIVNHFNLFQDDYKINSTHSAHKEIEFLAQHNYKFTLNLVPEIFNQNKVTLEWLYNKCTNKKSYHKCVKKSYSIHDSQFICWYAKLINDPTFLHKHFIYVDVVDLDMYINDTNYELSIKDIQYTNVNQEMFDYVINECKEKDNTLKLFKGVASSSIDLARKRKYLLMTAQTHKELQNKFVFTLCKIKLNNILNILYDFTKADIQIKVHYLFLIIGITPDSALSLKIIDKVLSVSDKTTWEWLCYFCYYHNFNKTFYFVYAKAYGVLNMDTIKLLYKGTSIVDITVSEHTFSFKLVTIIKKDRIHPFKSQMSKIINNDRILK